MVFEGIRMTAVAPATSEPRPALEMTEREQRFSLGAISWATYQEIARALNGRHVRLTYDCGRLEFMTISPRHGRLSRLLAQLVAALADEMGVPRVQFGDMTCDNEDALRGLEPDECFYLENEPLVRDREEIDLTVDPPPDLAIEIELSPSTKDRLAIYAALKVPEVWRFDGHRLTVHQLTDDGQYMESSESRYFPKISISELVGFIERRTQMDENSLLNSFREWVRKVLAR
jgi:Uma2 family endonuclease